MSSKPVNLRQFRKAKARKDKTERAEVNRILHGTPKALRDLEAARRQQAKSQIEAHKRERHADDLDDDV